MDKGIRTSASKLIIEPEKWRAFYETRDLRQRKLVAGYIAYVEEMAARGVPPIFEGRHLQLLLGVSGVEFARLTKRPEWYYRSFKVPKRSGGERTIVTPQPLMLHCQRWIDSFILRKITPHAAAHGYVAGRSNITNAEQHLGQSQLVCVDISNFFGTIKERRLVKLFLELGYPRQVCYLLSRICTYKGALPQGGASSPQLSNIIMSHIDEKITQAAAERGLRYTRYVDDITLSGERVGYAEVELVRDVLASEGFLLNRRKTRFQRGQRKIVTGVSIGCGKLKLPRSMRRAYKNQVFIALKRASELVDSDDPIVLDRQIGRLAYWRSVEKDNPAVEALFRATKKASKEGMPS